MKYLYLIIDLATLIIPLIFSFHPSIRFDRKWKSVLPAIFITAILFLIWDVWFTVIGVWSFNPTYIMGIYFFTLPVEEILFFICIPYACVFTYYCLNLFLKKDAFKTSSRFFIYSLLVLLPIIGLFSYNRLYTLVTFLLLPLFFGILRFYFKVNYLGQFIRAYLILLIPFTLVNGLLTGTALNAPVVLYNNAENLGSRLLTIPVEDIFYGMLLILMNVFIFEKREAKQVRT
jgi:lycopene cyclase domain-containing protein